MLETIHRPETDSCPDRVRRWASEFKPGNEILEIGFARGAIPQALIDAELRIYLAEASPARLGIFRKMFPEVPSACSDTIGCTFFNRTFDGVILCCSTGTMPNSIRPELLSRIERVLRSGGRLLVISASQSSPSKHLSGEDWCFRPSSDECERILGNLGLDVEKDVSHPNGDGYISAIKHVHAGGPY